MSDASLYMHRNNASLRQSTVVTAQKREQGSEKTLECVQRGGNRQRQRREGKTLGEHELKHYIVLAIEWIFFSIFLFTLP